MRLRPLRGPMIDEPARIRALWRTIAARRADLAGSRRRLADDLRRLRRLTVRMTWTRRRLRVANDRLRSCRRALVAGGGDP